eukprot:TRINITY_DN16648_c0_g1_i1.p1 TRINITY_DN16648_c0_g1~~TRINITY_DN16648_c0_g1_i1.p1  ORF type:complete len:144 (-),score=42.82 TRINITY_DN16648_c0_g1_i1:90-521(-)
MWIVGGYGERMILRELLIRGRGSWEVIQKQVVIDKDESDAELLKNIVKTTHENLPNSKQEDESIIVGTPELAKKLDKEAFEKKLDEVIKAHEELHLNTEVHFDPNGEHNDEFDHEAFLGDDAEEFRHLSPEESREKLGMIVNR